MQHVKWSESHSVVSNSLPSHGLYSPWNSPGQSTGVGTRPFSKGSSQPRDQIHVSRIAGRLPAKPQGKPKNIGVGILSLLLQIFPTQGLNLGLLHCRRILYQLSNEGSPYSTFKNRILGLPWLSRGWDIMLLPQGTSVWSLVEELGSHMLHVTKEQGQKIFFNKNSPYTPRASKWCKTEFTF